LARKPADVSLLDVVEAIDGPITLNQCTQDPTICSFGEGCPIHSVWCQTRADLVKKLRDATFDKMLKDEKEQSASV
jgi:DNA-binding IscR family transcriptional regulator